MTTLEIGLIATSAGLSLLLMKVTIQSYYTRRRAIAGYVLARLLMTKMAAGPQLHRDVQAWMCCNSVEFYSVMAVLEKCSCVRSWNVPRIVEGYTVQERWYAEISADRRTDVKV